MFDTRFESLDEFARKVAHMAEQVGRGFDKPSDDWAPVIIAMTRDGHAFVDLLPLSDASAKNFVFGEMIPNAIRERQIERIALVLSSWMVKTDSTSEAMDFAEGGIMMIPANRREEALMIVAHESGESVSLMTKIVRFPDAPPIIGAWSEMRGEDVLFQRHVDPIREALADV